MIARAFLQTAIKLTARSLHDYRYQTPEQRSTRGTQRTQGSDKLLLYLDWIAFVVWTSSLNQKRETEVDRVYIRDVSSFYFRARFIYTNADGTKSPMRSRFSLSHLVTKSHFWTPATIENGCLSRERWLSECVRPTFAQFRPVSPRVRHQFDPIQSSHHSWICGTSHRKRC